MKRLLLAVAFVMAFSSNGYAQSVKDDAELYVAQPWGVKIQFQGSTWELYSGRINEQQVLVRLAKKTADFVWRETGNKCFEIGFMTAGANSLSIICGSHPYQTSYSIKKVSGIWQIKR